MVRNGNRSQHVGSVLLLLTLILASINIYFRSQEIRNTEVFHMSNNNGIKSNATNASKYLLYMPHGGFTNQIMALDKAFALAYITNRKLVLPPILPHYTAHDIPRFGWKCRMYESARSPIHRVKADVIKLAQYGDILFPSFEAVIDFEWMRQQYGEESFIDLPEFIKILQGMHLNGTSVFEPRKWMKIFDEHFAEVKHSEASSGKYSQIEVAVIDSAFKLQLSPEIQKKFRCLRNFLPSNEVLQIIQRIRASLPPNYVGIHVRTDDTMRDCSHGRVPKTLETVRDELKSKNVTSNQTIYIASNLPVIKKCFLLKCVISSCSEEEQYANILTLDDILKHDTELKRLMLNVQSEISTISLIADKATLAGAEKLVMVNGMGMNSTYQDSLQERHRNRNKSQDDCIECCGVSVQ